MNCGHRGQLSPVRMRVWSHLDAINPYSSLSLNGRQPSAPLFLSHTLKFLWLPLNWCHFQWERAKGGKWGEETHTCDIWGSFKSKVLQYKHLQNMIINVLLGNWFTPGWVILSSIEINVLLLILLLPSLSLAKLSSNRHRHSKWFISSHLKGSLALVQKVLVLSKPVDCRSPDWKQGRKSWGCPAVWAVLLDPCDLTQRYQGHPLH